MSHLISSLDGESPRPRGSGGGGGAAATIVACFRAAAAIVLAAGIAAPAAAATALAWEAGHPERRPWSETLRRELKKVLSTFDAADDAESFCDDYADLNADQRVEVWATMAVKLAYHESNYNPRSVMHEPPPLNYRSIGLFQLSYEDSLSWCDASRREDNLRDPLLNIKCAVPLLAKLVRRDGVIATGRRGSARGAARYWSALWRDRHYSSIRSAPRQLAMCR